MMTNTDLRAQALDHAIHSTTGNESPSGIVARAQTYYAFLIGNEKAGQS